MRRHTDQLTNPTIEQQQAWASLNFALGALAAGYNIDSDQLNESVGRYTEEIVSVLVDGPEAA